MGIVFIGQIMSIEYVIKLEVIVMEIKFDNNMAEQNFNFQGVKVKVRKNDETKYQIWIEDNENRFIQSKLPGAYEYLCVENNNITFDDVCKKWWSALLFDISLYGYFNNGDIMNLKQIDACVNAVFNGVNTLEKLHKSEIKVGDYVKPKDYISDYKYKIIGIYNDEIWAQSIGRRSITAIYRKDTFVKDNTKL